MNSDEYFDIIPSTILNNYITLNRVYATTQTSVNK